ncbi:hypothetical protein [Micromonospora sp. NPDC005806]|uniref:hypothetical protein n=1 Tax=Micromonospora sp. NPDC005806 TaxID=3364234 RepID=UPI00369F543D
MERMARGQLEALVLVDDCDRIPPRTLRKLVEKRRGCLGLLLTANQISVDISAHLSEEGDYYLPIPPLEQRPDELLLIASTIWQQLVGPRGDDLARSCDELAVRALSEGPYPDGAWSLQRVLTDVIGLLESSGDLVAGRLQRSISYADIAPLLLRLARERVAVAHVAPTNAVLVVEGDTDESYLHSAARLANEWKGWRLLDGLTVEAAARGRGGGGTEVVRRVQNLHREGIPALGLFDYDIPGRDAYDLAGRNGLQRLLLPVEFDPLRRDSQFAIVEIEDLLPVELLIQYYELHDDKSPEEQHWRLGHLRIVPLGENKGEIAGWVSGAATYQDLERMVHLLVQVRQQLRLPCTREMADRGWLRLLQHQPVARSLSLDNGRRPLVPEQRGAPSDLLPR